MAVEKILVIIRPNNNGDVDKIIAELDEHGKRLEYATILSPTREEWEQHYSPHRRRLFFRVMVEDFAGKPATIAVYEGNPEEFERVKGKLRREYATGPLDSKNRHMHDVLHISSPGDFRREWGVWKSHLNF